MTYLKKKKTKLLTRENLEKLLELLFLELLCLELLLELLSELLFELLFELILIQNGRKLATCRQH